jgi:Rhodopirellula transposase DDE domain
MRLFYFMSNSIILAAVRRKFELLRPLMTERLLRQWAASEAESLGRGGTTTVAQATGLSRTTVWTGLRELQVQSQHPEQMVPPERVRAVGAGRPIITGQDPTLLHDLERLLETTTRGDPQCPLRWTCKSTRNLAEELGRQGHVVSHKTVATLLHDLDYSLQANRKTKEGKDHPDRNAQFEHIAQQVGAFQKQGQPVVSIDTKKKELIGDFKNAGQEWHSKGQPEKVRSKDFKDKHLGKATPEGVYDLTRNEGWVSVGIDHATAWFATETLRRWWQEMGVSVYPKAQRLLITADAGGNNGYRLRVWKVAVQELADTVGLQISVCHFPPGTSKWTKIEHRMFCHITQNWRGKPLTSRAVIVNLIGNTKTKSGLHVHAELDANTYKTGVKVSDEELAAVKLTRDDFHGDWNYTISPRI